MTANFVDDVDVRGYKKRQRIPLSFFTYLICNFKRFKSSSEDSQLEHSLGTPRVLSV